jgi:glycosyltransferase involved in cell wall biosynthesis
MIHDLSFVSFPQGYRSHERLVYNTFIRQSARKAREILTVSEFSKREICDLWKIPAEKVTVTYNGLEASFRNVLEQPERRAASSEAPYILYVGNLHPRKNLVCLLQAFGALKAEKKIPHRLKIVGQKAWLYSDIFKAVQGNDFSKEVDFTGYVDERELIRLYQGASVTVYPSLYEGFGLPVLEAMACGSPVVTSKTTALPEVAGDAALLIDPTDVSEMAAAIFKVVASQDLQQNMRAKGRAQAQKFSWIDTAQKTWRVYQRAGQ